MMKFITTFMILLSLTCVWMYHEAMRTFVQKCTSECSEQYCNIRSVCRPINKTSKLISIDIYFHPGVKIEAPIYVELNAYKRFTTVYRPFMIRIKNELCHELKQKGNLLFKLTVADNKDGNILDPCPFSGHRYLTPRYSSDKTFLLPLIPVGEWKFELNFTTIVNGSERFVYSWAIYYDIKPSGAEQF